MPAYCNNTVAQLRQKCEKRGIEHDGLTKTGLMEALREVDLRDYYNECVRQNARPSKKDNGRSKGLCDENRN